MKDIYFATGNREKIQIAKSVCEPQGLKVISVDLDIDEIQGEDPEIIVRDKAMRAFEKVKEPIVVSDDTWDIVALKGFPGAYMKSINYWFSSDDFLRLMHGIEDRRVILHQYLAYTDGNVTEVFVNDIPGKITYQARGRNDKSPNMTVIEIDSDNGKTIAEIFEQDKDTITERYKKRRDVWHEFVDWYKNTI